MSIICSQLEPRSTDQHKWSLLILICVFHLQQKFCFDNILISAGLKDRCVPREAGASQCPSGWRNGLEQEPGAGRSCRGRQWEAKCNPKLCSSSRVTRWEGLLGCSAVTKLRAVAEGPAGMGSSSLGVPGLSRGTGQRVRVLPGRDG